MQPKTNAIAGKTGGSMYWVVQLGAELEVGSPPLGFVGPLLHWFVEPWPPFLLLSVLHVHHVLSGQQLKKKDQDWLNKQKKTYYASEDGDLLEWSEQHPQS